MNIVIGMNPKTNKKETFRFNNNDEGFELAKSKLKQIKNKKYKEAYHESKTMLSNIWGL
jgi:hypothetical protein|tara:strand:+ start:1602 stop:1778 length:177 start_codon:yes stop_codon:yes gene_type:complete